MERPPEILKPLAQRLARLATSNEGAEMSRLLDLAGLISATSDQSTTTPPATSPDYHHIGIWERRSEDGRTYFVRRNELRDQWPLWANIGRINPKSRRLRVVFLGESAARGYLYDPQYTPAMALESVLQSHLGKDAVEVIDLARTDLQITMLLELARAAIAFEPDAIVIFAGNNWHPALIDFGGRRSAAANLRRGGVKGLKEYAENELRIRVENLVKTVAATYAAKDIPVVWLVPEYNLEDWRDPDGTAPCLGEADSEWEACRRQAHAALVENDTNSAASFAHRMVQLDGGTSATGFYLLAECALRTGDRAGRRKYLESARDALICDMPAYLTPRPYSVAQDTLRREAERHGNAVVDLPQVYSTYLGGELPGRQLFLDYVHLTAEGIKIAAAATASCLLNKLKGVHVSLESLAEKVAMPKPQVEAEAVFMGAVHNAHHGKAYDVFRYHCCRAVESSPAIVRMMQPFIDMQTRRAPFWLCKSAEQLATAPSPSVPQYLLKASIQVLDPLLVGALIDALKKIGINAERDITELRRQEHSVSRSACNMLDYYYCMSSPFQRGLSWNLPLTIKVGGLNHYYKAHERESRFFFVGERSTAVELQLACRLPGAGVTDAEVALKVNGNSIGAITAGSQWQTWKIFVSGDVVHDDVNEVSICWPEVEYDHVALIERAAADMENGLCPELYPVLGEVHTFVALAAGPNQN